MARVRDDKILVRIALVLKELRDEYEVSQEEVYNETGVHIARIESGQSNPTISTIGILTKYFNIKFSEFFKRVESRTERKL
jgi:transcriptional regulator with XRE-family HTH domain